MTQTTCQNFATFRYTWPGKDEAFCCTMHAKGIQAVADAMGLYQQMIPIGICAETDHPKCSSYIKEPTHEPTHSDTGEGEAIGFRRGIEKAADMVEADGAKLMARDIRKLEPDHG